MQKKAHPLGAGRFALPVLLAAALGIGCRHHGEVPPDEERHPCDPYVAATFRAVALGPKEAAQVVSEEQPPLPPEADPSPREGVAGDGGGAAPSGLVTFVCPERDLVLNDQSPIHCGTTRRIRAGTYSLRSEGGSGNFQLEVAPGARLRVEVTLEPRGCD